jgi:hypothetical protein
MKITYKMKAKRKDLPHTSKETLVKACLRFDFLQSRRFSPKRAFRCDGRRPSASGHIRQTSSTDPHELPQEPPSKVPRAWVANSKIRTHPDEPDWEAACSCLQLQLHSGNNYHCTEVLVPGPGCMHSQVAAWSIVERTARIRRFLVV